MTFSTETHSNHLCVYATQKKVNKSGMRYYLRVGSTKNCRFFFMSEKKQIIVWNNNHILMMKKFEKKKHLKIEVNKHFGLKHIFVV